MRHLRSFDKQKSQRIFDSLQRLGDPSTLSTRAFIRSHYAQETYYVEEEPSWTDDPKPLTEKEKTTLVNRMIRSNVLSEVAASRLATGQRCSQRRRPDLQFREERERELLKKVEGLVPQYRVRPSLLRPLASAVGLGLGAVSSILPKQAAGAITGGIQDALTERYNDQLRELRAAGLTETAADLREAVLQLRDEERAPLEAVQAPDLLKLQRPQELTAEEAVAGIVKYGMKGLLDLGARI